MDRRKGFRIVHEFDGHTIVSMIEFKGRILIATTQGVFWFNEIQGKFVPIPFEVTDAPVEPTSVAHHSQGNNQEG